MKVEPKWIRSDSIKLKYQPSLSGVSNLNLLTVQIQNLFPKQTDKQINSKSQQLEKTPGGGAVAKLSALLTSLNFISIRTHKLSQRMKCRSLHSKWSPPEILEIRLDWLEANSPPPWNAVSVSQSFHHLI